ncbi:chromodomain-helicase-DNA-binding protein 1-like [Tropilaelaps mercedesae]|uniref:Chromodomain-helicase-DNA-binding protein 1 n=1 Tax=Tropilaelaps mercedesae TaxID=418985 RepID=A0A1V9XAG6_9ACAR|nr:chromodomain-helicase-DNA-binding protein 1-like [Tropilaelaps mercedesae]
MLILTCFVVVFFTLLTRRWCRPHPPGRSYSTGVFARCSSIFQHDEHDSDNSSSSAGDSSDSSGSEDNGSTSAHNESHEVAGVTHLGSSNAANAIENHQIDDNNENRQVELDSSDSDSDQSSQGAHSVTSSDSEPDAPAITAPPKKNATRATQNRRNEKPWEEDPDMYGVRRSGRAKPVTKRFTVEVKSASNNSRRPQPRKERGWSEDSDSGGSERPAPKRRRKQPVAPSPSSDDDDYSEDEVVQRASARRGTRQRVSYKEAHEEETDEDDLMSVDGEDTNNGLVEEDNAEAVEKVLDKRMGVKGATGSATTVYAVEKNGDPNRTAGESGVDLEQQFLIKWKNWSHLHNTWETMETLQNQGVKGLKRVENFLKKEEELQAWKDNATPEEIEYFDCQQEMSEELYTRHQLVERIICELPSRAHHPDPVTEYHNSLQRLSQGRKARDGAPGDFDYYCKWEGLPYSECTWEDASLIKDKFRSVIDAFHARQQSTTIPNKHNRALINRPKFHTIKRQPDYVGGPERLRLRDYQLEGLNWLANSWCKSNSCILADEMGLGKTIQTISFLSYLFNEYQLYGPFLMIVPLSTLVAWQREFTNWAPEMNVVTYLGDVVSRELIRDFEWFVTGTKRIKFNVLLSTPEIMLKDGAFINEVEWAVLAVDEAHRLKNDEAQLYRTLRDLRTKHRLLITGTPLQNSLKELWALLHFIEPDRFPQWDSFEREHKDTQDKGYNKLHKQLEPYLLRRVKKDVEKSLPAKVERILRVEMTSLQKQYYKWILTKNYKMLTKGLKGSQASFVNIMVELKKCCNHGLLIRPPETTNSQDALTQLIRGSGKLLLLDKLLCRLKETGHRVLIFSQMVRMLDIISEYLKMRRFQFQRLDGSIKGETRKQALDHFNAEGSQDFCFLLSTRAGGLGINLATADTVVIFDSDWNPQNDLQAQARAHRIGQKNQVNIYRLVTKGSVEEDIIERAKRKMVLDHLVIQRMDTSGRTVLHKGGPSSNSSTPFNKEELAAILKFGAEDLFKEEDNSQDGGGGEAQEGEMDIDEILQRAETREDAPSTMGDELLGSFKVQSFNFNEEEVSQTLPDYSGKTWEDIIPEAERKKIEEEERQREQMELYLPPRQRRTNFAELEDGGADAGEGHAETLGSFSDNEIRRFVKSYKKYPAAMKRLDVVANDADLQDKAMVELRKLATVLEKGCRDSMVIVTQAKLEEKVRKKEKKERGDEAKEDEAEEDNKTKHKRTTFKLGGIQVNAKSVLTAIEELAILDVVMPSTPAERSAWRADCPFKDPGFGRDWTPQDDSNLLRGIYEYGMGSWEQIRGDASLQLKDKILLPDPDSKPQAKHLQSRAESLLKLLKRVNNKKQKKLLAAQKRRERAEKRREDSKRETENRKERDKSSGGGGGKDRERDREREKGSDRGGGSSKRDSSHSHSSSSTHHTHTGSGSRADLIASIPVGSGGGGSIDPIDELPKEVFNECKEKMRPVKKALKQLDPQDRSLTKDEQIRQIRRCLVKIGDRINECLEEYPHDRARQWRSYLWAFVSKFTDLESKQLYKLYKHSVKKGSTEDSQNGAAATGAATAAVVSSLAP